VLKEGEKPARDGKDYQWYEMGFFTRWNGKQASRVLCIDTPPGLREKLLAALQGATDVEFRDPLGMFRPLLDGIIECCDTHTWKVSKQVREVEKVRLWLLHLFTDTEMS
jgi:hypothetical protein